MDPEMRLRYKSILKNLARLIWVGHHVGWAFCLPEADMEKEVLAITQVAVSITRDFCTHSWFRNVWFYSVPYYRSISIIRQDGISCKDPHKLYTMFTEIKHLFLEHLLTQAYGVSPSDTNEGNVSVLPSHDLWYSHGDPWITRVAHFKE